MPIKKSILKDAVRKISLNKGKFFCLLLFIITSSLVFTGLKVAPEEMRKTASSYYKQTNFFDLKITSSIGFTNNDKTSLKQIDGVKAVSLIKTLEVLTTIDDKDYVIKLKSINNNRNLKNEDYINHLSLTSGKYPSTINEGLVEEKFLKENNLKLGDLITLNPDNDEDLRAKKIKIVGTVKNDYPAKSESSNLVDNKTIDYVMYLDENDFSTNKYNEGFITIKNANKYNTYSQKYKNLINGYNEKINKKIKELAKESYASSELSLKEEINTLKGELNELNQTDLPVESLGDSVKQLTEKLKDKEDELNELNNYSVSSEARNNTPSFYEYELEIEKIKSISTIFPYAFLIIVSLVCFSIVANMINEDKQNIINLNIIGYSKFSASFKYVLYSLLIVLLGNLIGGLLFYKLIPLLISLLYKNLYEMPVINASINLKYTLISLLITFLISVLIISIKFFALFRKKANKTVKNKNKLLEKINSMYKKLGFSNKIVLKNIFKNKKGSLINTFIILALTTILITTFGIKDSALSTIDKQFNKINKYDIKISFYDKISSTDKEKLLSQITYNKNVDDAIEISSSLVTIKNKRKTEESNLYVPNDKNKINEFIYLRSVKNKEALKLNNKGIIISEKLFQSLGANKNDKIQITLNEGKKINVKISEVTKNYIGNYIYMSPSLYKEINDDKIGYNNILINTKKLNKNEEKNLVSYLSKLENVKKVEVTKDEKETYEKNSYPLNHVITVLTLFTLLIFYISIYNVINRSTQKNGLLNLKQKGFYNKEILKYIYKNNNLIFGVGITLGLILGSFLTYFIVNNLNVSTITFSFKISLFSYLLSVIIILLLALIISLLTILKLNKTNVSKKINKIM